MGGGVCEEETRRQFPGMEGTQSDAPGVGTVAGPVARAAGSASLSTGGFYLLRRAWKLRLVRRQF